MPERILYESNHPEFKTQKRQFEYHHTLNNKTYAVECPDILEPADENAFVICTYEGSDYPAGIAYANDYKACTFAFPFETIKDKASRDTIMIDVLDKPIACAASMNCFSRTAITADRTIRV